MDRILIILKKENGPRASSAPALGLNTILFKHVYWYMQQISGERLQDHWSSGYKYLMVNLVFSNHDFWSGNFFLIAPFLAHCLLLRFYGLHLCLQAKLLTKRPTI